MQGGSGAGATAAGNLAVMVGWSIGQPHHAWIWMGDFQVLGVPFASNSYDPYDRGSWRNFDAPIRSLNVWRWSKLSGVFQRAISRYYLVIT